MQYDKHISQWFLQFVEPFMAIKVVQLKEFMASIGSIPFNMQKFGWRNIDENKKEVTYFILGS